MDTVLNLFDDFKFLFLFFDFKIVLVYLAVITILLSLKIKRNLLLKTFIAFFIVEFCVFVFNENLLIVSVNLIFIDYIKANIIKFI